MQEKFPSIEQAKKNTARKEEIGTKSGMVLEGETKAHIDALLDSLKEQGGERNIHRVANKVVRAIIPFLYEKYPDKNQSEQWKPNDSKLYFNLAGILETLPDHDVRGKIILDLGCGSIGGTYESESMNKERQFEPWLSRILHAIGGRPIGIDVGDLSEEHFEHYSRDLTKKEALSMISDDSVDLAFATAFYDSPELGKRSGASFHDSQKESVRQKLLPQLKRVLKDDAVFLESDAAFEDVITRKEDM